MGSSDATVPPFSAMTGLVCPVCRRAYVEEEATYTRGVAGAVPRCPEHGLAFVKAADLAQAATDHLLGETVAGRFTVLSIIGTGSMGAVYRARQETVGRDVALKIVRGDRRDRETRARFEREARATSALVSPNTVTVFDFGEAEDAAWFLAMELLTGESLGDRLRRQRRLPVAEAIRVTREALMSLAEAHAKGIIHRDLKPDNLFLATVPDAGGGHAAEVCKVLDFGIAKMMHVEHKVDQLETQAGTVFGTPRYMSPEQAQGGDIDARTDIYSLGVILYQMLSGQAPFVDEDAVVVMARHIKDDPPRFSEVAPDVEIPFEIDRVVWRALAKDPEDRPQSAEQFTAALEDAAQKAGVSDTGVLVTAHPAMPFLRPTIRRRLVWAAGVVGVVALFWVGFAVIRDHRPPPGAGMAARGAAAAAAPPKAPAIVPPGPSGARSAPASTPAPSASAAPSATPKVKRTKRFWRPPAASRPAPPSVAEEPKAKYPRFE